MEKACSIMVSKVKSQSMAGRGDFSKMWFFFPQGILTFFYACFYAGGKMLIFLDVIFFGFARVCFKKQQKKDKRILRLRSFWQDFIFLNSGTTNFKVL